MVSAIVDSASLVKSDAEKVAVLLSKTELEVSTDEGDSVKALVLISCSVVVATAVVVSKKIDFLLLLSIAKKIQNLPQSDGLVTTMY